MSWIKSIYNVDVSRSTFLSLRTLRAQDDMLVFVTTRDKNKDLLNHALLTSLFTDMIRAIIILSRT